MMSKTPHLLPGLTPMPDLQASGPHPHWGGLPPGPFCQKPTINAWFTGGPSTDVITIDHRAKPAYSQGHVHLPRKDA
jgi:hypothetical protein